jgi:aspartyl-tRNA(Asn)/glutamyl-tRNA(Gln) amidotransferase subunit A
MITMPGTEGRGTAELCALSMADLVDLVARRKVSPVEMCRASLARFEATEPELNAFISLEPERVLADAARLEADVMRGGLLGPLHGVPIAIKDNIATRGERTTAGSTVYGTHRPDHDATVVRRLRAAGALLFGKTNLPEFAYGPVDSYHYGPTRNPWDATRYAGGSSMGSGAAVAAGVVPGALGTDTTGSIRNPATWCGVVGLKPTYGLVPLRGVVPLATCLDHVGPLARSSEDCARVLSVIAGIDHLDPTSSQYPLTDYSADLNRSVAGVRLGVVRPLWAALDAEIAASLESALVVLRDLGAELVDVEMPRWDEAAEAGTTLVACEAAVEYGRILDASASELLPEVRQRLTSGATKTAADYVRAKRVGSLFRHGYREAMRDVDLLAIPGHHCTAPRIDANGSRLDPSTSLQFVMPLNVAGAPALAIPAGVIGGLPISLQLAGARGAESLVLMVAHAFQQATSWHERRPPAPQTSK